MDFQVKQAKRELIWVKVALMGPSGSGKTYSALKVATGMAKEIEKQTGKPAKILMGNTEQKRGYYYANEFKYDIVDIASPHNPEKYVEFMEWAVDQKYDILILDSSSHEWIGKGGCLQIQQEAGGTYQAWGKVTPRHNKFIETIADSPIHLIATMRGKDQYELSKNDDGKVSVKKLGVGAEQRSGLEYEFTASFMLDQKTNLAEVEKDNTHLFENEGDVLFSEKDGEKLIKWANSGEGYSVPVRNTETEQEKLNKIKDDIIVTVTGLGGSKNEELMKILKTFEPSGNPKKIKDEATLNNLKSSLAMFKEAQETKSTESEKENK